MLITTTINKKRPHMNITRHTDHARPPPQSFLIILGLLKPNWGGGARERGEGCRSPTYLFRGSPTYLGSGERRGRSQKRVKTLPSSVLGTWSVTILIISPSCVIRWHKYGSNVRVNLLLINMATAQINR